MEQSADNLDEMVRRSLVARKKQTLVVNNVDGSTTFCCVVCPMKYPDKESMELHLCMHNKEYRFICSICGTGLKRKEHLERHTQGHFEVRPHVCPECGKAFKRKEHLNIHSAIHTGHKDIACSLCARTFHRKDHLQKHLQSHSKRFVRLGAADDHPTQNLQPVLFNVCGNATELHDQLTKEETECKEEVTSQSSPIDPLRPHRCQLCPKTYKRRDHLKLHQKSHFKNPFTCSECKLGFPTEAQLFVHMNDHLKAESLLESDADPTDLLILEDQSCQTLDTDNLLVPRTAREEQRPHECPVCHKRFKRRQHLVTHSNVHKRERSIWCSLCNEGFTTNEEFEQHECKMLNAESGGDSENINGVQMQSNFMDIEVEDDYLVKVQEQPVTTLSSGAEAAPVPQRVFVCKFCGKPFRRRDHYKIHLNIHTGVRSFFCKQCGKGFYRKDHLQKHEPTHLRQKRKKEMPELFPISQLTAKPAALPTLPNLPEITIHAPSKLRIPLQMKVPYEVVTSTEYGEQRAVVHPKEQCVR